MPEETEKDRLLNILSYKTGRVTEEGVLAKVDGVMLLRGDADVLLATLEASHLRDLLQQIGHSGFFP